MKGNRRLGIWGGGGGGRRPLSASFTLFPPPTTSVDLKASRLHVSNGGQAVREPGSSAAIAVQNDDALDSIVFEIRARNRIGLLKVITRVFGVLGLKIDRAVVEFQGKFFVKRFFVTPFPIQLIFANT
nr:glycogen phosphorylase 1-like [Ipomoea batatas]